jgi:hypothetical protein
MGKLFYFSYVKSRPPVAGKCPTAAISVNDGPSAGTPTGVEKRKLAEADFLCYLRQLEKLRQMK